MAHEVETGFTARVPAWHRLGNVTEGTLNAEEAIKAAGLDWQVEMKPVYVEVRPGEIVPDPDRRAVVRSTDGKILGNHGTSYVPCQNEVLTEAAQAILDQLRESEGVDDGIDTAWALREGRHVNVTIALPEDATINGDVHHAYLTLSNSHDGTRAVRATASAIRVVCANTQRLSDIMGVSFSLRHTMQLNGYDFAAQAVKALDLTNASIRAFRKEVEQLQNLDLSFGEAAKVFDTVTGVGDTDLGKGAITRRENARQTIEDIYRMSTTIGDFTGTAWGVVQAVNEYEQWFSPRKGGEAGRLDRLGRLAIGLTTDPMTEQAKRLVLA